MSYKNSSKKLKIKLKYLIKKGGTGFFVKILERYETAGF